jgi:hypothetical protein
LEDEGAVIHLDAQDEKGRPLNDLNVSARLIAPDLTTTEMTLTQVGPGKYEAVTRADQPGTYLAWVAASNNEVAMGQMTLGMVVPYSPEYRAGGVNQGLLDELARVTGGGPLEAPVQAFLHNLPAVDTAREIGRILLLIAALLFPLDVALRRVMISSRDIQSAKTWLKDRIPGRASRSGDRESPVLGQLFNARDRARRRTYTPLPERETAADLSDQTPAMRDEQEKAEQKSPKPSENTPDTLDQADALSRLREAKKRARR